MEDTSSEVDESLVERIFAEIIISVKNDVVVSWAEEKGGCETHVALITSPQKEVRLRISQDAFEAAEDPGNIPRLTSEVARQLRVSESAKAAGHVHWPERI